MTLPAIDNVVPLPPLVAAVFARLEAAATTARWYIGQPTEAIPTKVVDGDDTGIVVPHGILYPSPGTPTGEDDLADTAIDLDWYFQLQLVGGYERDVEALITRATSALYRWAPTVDGLVCGPLKPPPGYDPGPIRRDTTVKPVRFFVPLQFANTITRT